MFGKWFGNILFADIIFLFTKYPLMVNKKYVYQQCIKMIYYLYAVLICGYIVGILHGRWVVYLLSACGLLGNSVVQLKVRNIPLACSDCEFLAIFVWCRKINNC